MNGVGSTDWKQRIHRQALYAIVSRSRNLFHWPVLAVGVGLLCTIAWWAILGWTIFLCLNYF